MKQLSGSLLFILLYFTSCQMIQSNRSKAEQTAVSFCEAFYNFDYTVAGKLATATSLPYIRFFASNITQEQLDKAKERGPVTVTIVGSHADDETSATVICQIEEPIGRAHV